MHRKTLSILLFCASPLAVAPVSGEVTRMLRVEIPDAARNAFAVENLVGRMRVTSGGGEAASVIATVHAEDAALANTIRLEQATGDPGKVVVHVHYPESERSLRYPAGNEDGGWVLGLLSVGEGLRYQGRRFRVSRSSGRLLYVDLEVHLPARVADGTFRNQVGRLDANGVEGKITFDVDSADLRLERLRGDVALHGTSGDIKASDITGTWDSTFTSGDCTMRGFRGESLAFHTTSGDVEARDVQATRLRIRSTSGDYSIRDADVEDVEASATSGNVELDQRSTRLARLRLEATSGDVLLLLPREASFEAVASATSGDVNVRYDDVTFLRHDREPARYRHGSGGAQIEVRTTSGNLTIKPR
jgi:putative adhesin